MPSELNKVQEKGKVLPFLLDGDLFFKKGLKEYRNTNYKEALRYFERAYELEPDLPYISLQLANVLSEVGDYLRSNEILDHTLQANPDLLECHYFLASNYAYLGFFLEAENHARKFVEECTDSEYLDDALDLLEMLAVEEEDEGYSVKEESLIFKQELAKDLLEKGQLQKGMKLFQEIIEEHPKYWPAYNNLAIAFLHLGKAEEAIERLNYILKNSPGNLHALCNLAVVYHQIHSYSLMEELLDQLENVEPIYIEHRVKLGATFGIVGRYERAYKWLRSAQKQGFQETSTFLYWLAICSYEIGNYELADSVWERFSKKNPEQKDQKPWLLKEKLLKEITDQFPIDLYIDDFISQDFPLEEQMLALYLLVRNVLHDEASKHELKKGVCESSKISPFIKMYVEALCDGESGEIEDPYRKTMMQAVAVADQIHARESLSEIFSVELHLFAWFESYILFFKNIELENASAFAGAFTYLLMKKHKCPMTQKEICELFDVSIATLRKYIQKVSDIIM